ncbi:hypothetical protein [Kitasatospora sp. NPDC051914]|uniref:hypothetical protein n=1 Tax=Kitasatospora sp. NPDC051914 TaxID=3154945 RepID=UPI00342DB6E4
MNRGQGGTGKTAGQAWDGVERRAQPAGPGERAVPAWRDPSRPDGFVVGRLLSGVGSQVAGAL